ncbi:MAG: PA14 domain-containing protein [Ilumatobacteraceae bacterium]
MTTATGSGATAIPPSLVLAPGVSAAGLVATSGSGGWTLTMTPGMSGGAPTFVCTTAAASTLASTWPAVHDGQVGVVFATVGIPASGGAGPYAWSAAGLPQGLTIGPDSGTIYGTPQAAGTFSVAITITDAASTSVSKTYSIAIAASNDRCPTTVTGWRGEYFANSTLGGVAVLCRDDADIRFDWGSGPPSAAVPTDVFSVRWTRTLSFVAGTYTFTMGADDGSRLIIDGTLVLERWVDQSYPAVPPAVTLTVTGGDHVVVMEYYERSGSARATLDWALAPPEPVACSTPVSGWLAEYYPNTALAGPRSGCQDVAAIDVDWGSGGPAIVGMPADNFSVRWTRTQTYAAGAYTFTMGSDDGSRLMIDGSTVLEQWSDHAYPGSPPTVTVTLTQGPHTVVMEHYERGGLARAVLTVSPPP